LANARAISGAANSMSSMRTTWTAVMKVTY